MADLPKDIFQETTSFTYFTPRHRNTGLVPSGVGLTSQGEGVSLALVGHPSNDGITIRTRYEIDVLLRRPASHPIFHITLVKTKSDFIVRTVETGLWR